MKLTTGKVKRADRNFPLAEYQGGGLSTMDAGLMFGNGFSWRARRYSTWTIRKSTYMIEL